MKKLHALAIIIVVLLIAGLLVPLGSYTTTQGCQIEPTPTKRLHIIFGDTLEKIKQSDVQPPPSAGCSANTKYVLYFL